VTVAGEGTTTRVAVTLEAAPTTAAPSATTTAATAPPPAAEAVAVPAPAPSAHRRAGFGVAFGAGYAKLPTAELGVCGVPSTGGDTFDLDAFVDLTAASWLRIRTGLRWDYASSSYAAPPQACSSSSIPPPSSVSYNLGAAFLQAAPLIASGAHWELHALLGAALVLPINSGKYVVAAGGTMPIPGLDFASPVSSAGELGIGAIYHGVTVDAMARIQRVQPNPNSPDALDLGLLTTFLVSVGYTSWY
jgi:hypothetical protein